MVRREAGGVGSDPERRGGSPNRSSFYTEFLRPQRGAEGAVCLQPLEAKILSQGSGRMSRLEGLVMMRLARWWLT